MGSRIGRVGDAGPVEGRGQDRRRSFVARSSDRDLPVPRVVEHAGRVGVDDRGPVRRPRAAPVEPSVAVSQLGLAAAGVHDVDVGGGDDVPVVVAHRAERDPRAVGRPRGCLVLEVALRELDGFRRCRRATTVNTCLRRSPIQPSLSSLNHSRVNRRGGRFFSSSSSYAASGTREVNTMAGRRATTRARRRPPSGP